MAKKSSKRKKTYNPPTAKAYKAFIRILAENDDPKTGRKQIDKLFSELLTVISSICAAQIALIETAEGWTAADGAALARVNDRLTDCLHHIERGESAWRDLLVSKMPMRGALASKLKD